MIKFDTALVAVRVFLLCVSIGGARYTRGQFAVVFLVIRMLIIVTTAWDFGLEGYTHLYPPIFSSTFFI